TVSSGPTTTRARRMKPSARRSEQTCNRPARAKQTPRPDFPVGAICFLSRGGDLVVARLELLVKLFLVELVVDELNHFLACGRLLSQETRGDVRIRQFVGVPLQHRTAIFLVPVEARPRRDQLADDHVLLQADERVLLTGDRRACQHLDRVLEGRRRQEAVRAQGGLRDAEQHVLGARRRTTKLDDLLVDAPQQQLIDHLARQQFGVTTARYLHLRQHTADDHLEVLVGDVHALLAVHVLYLAEQVVRGCFHAQDLEDPVRVLRAFGERVARLDTVAIAQAMGRAIRIANLDDTGCARKLVLALLTALPRDPQDVPVDGYTPVVLGRKDFLAALGERVANRDLSAVLDKHLPLADIVLLVEDFGVHHADVADALALVDVHDAVDVADDGFTLRLLTRFEDLFYTRQTGGDVAPLLCRTARVEGTERELRARLANRLGSNDTDRRADSHQVTTTQVAAIAKLARAEGELARHWRAHIHVLHARPLDQLGFFLLDHLVAVHDELTRLRVVHRPRRHTTNDTLVHRLPGHRFGGPDPDAGFGPAVMAVDDHVLRNVHQTAGQVTCVRGTQRRVSQTLAGAVRADEVLKRRQPFTEVAQDGQVDDTTGRIGHQTTHTRKLSNGAHPALRGARVGHDRHAGVFVQRPAHSFLHTLLGACPLVDGRLVALILSQQTTAVLAVDLADGCLRLAEDNRALLRHGQVADGDRRTGVCRILEAQVLDRVHNIDRDLRAKPSVRLPDKLVHALLVKGTVHPAKFVRQDAVEDAAAHRRHDRLIRLLHVPIVDVLDQDRRVQLHLPQRERHLDFVDVVEGAQFRGVDTVQPLIRSFHRQIVHAEHHILARANDGRAVCWLEQVPRAEHQLAGLFHG